MLNGGAGWLRRWLRMLRCFGFYGLVVSAAMRLAATVSTTATAGMPAAVAAGFTSTAGSSAAIVALLATAVAGGLGARSVAAGRLLGSWRVATARLAGTSLSTTGICRACLVTAAPACIVSAAACIATLRCKAAAPVVPSAAIIHEAMLTPAVPIAPAGPWAHAQENAVVEVARPIESHRRAFIRD